MAVFTHSVTRFIARRLLYSLVVLLGVLVVVFALVHLVPGDPVRIALGTRYTPEAYNALRSASGLDKPIVEQFLQLCRLRAHRRPRRQLPQR
jgi:peptide/nickel transport system permease protein